ncbi:SulP family inorganic anion transporter [Mycolicibacterium mucogenicum]|uniref:Carbonic anhydrase n=1 Tax=Mycolicibacterium mucogenicum DSM 44124 TaxID=1226753 RepID=A0A8H2JF96_MYCMU|nr:bifunctional SulP family inorganic anion transporter/carbonic anhydrase [Mycolicibacterium mucogenicum]KAB7755665.1 carbonic anhydrase [Mycolicibacterium mucogenicum DSM 44124]QPG68408.1 bifunctional SulP family inorganic anion transporter/carbonic anhydrase [Mycolicibacterium mucogenicum DSM 44124]
MLETAPPAKGLRAILRYDLPASLVVFLVALPLSLGIAVASNAPILAGIIAAIVGGIVAGALGGSPLQVSGPAAGLTVIVAGLIAEFGWGVTCAITVGAGLLQILFGLSRVARAALAISPVVVHAMLAGIGITIALQQMHVLLGGKSNSSAWENIEQLPAQLMNIQGAGFLLGMLVIVILVAWRWVPAPINRIPGPLVAIVGVTALSVLLPFDVKRIQINGSLLDSLSLPTLPTGDWDGIIAGVLTVALIASVESLLSAVSVDRMQNGPRTNFDRELIGQGAANTLSGAIGGLPVTGVIVRSSTNVAAGAKTRASAILHGVWILLFAVPFAGLAQLIPTSALAGLLIVIGCQLVKKAHIETARRTGDIAVYVITVLGVVFLNLLEGVLIGLALAVALTVWRVIRAKIVTEHIAGNDWRIVIEGSVSFLSLPRLTSALAAVPTGSNVTVELSVDFIDHAAHETIDEWKRQHIAGGGSVEIHEHGTAELHSATAGPPTRTFTPFDKRSGVVPWKSQPQTSSVMEGLETYHRRTAPVLRPHMEDLAHAQKPETLFITCVDSRVVPNVITSSGPGDLLTVRNVGNLIPEGRADASVEAAIAFAVEVLEVRSIVVCGHSSCGAMTALLGGDQGHDEHLHTWLEHGEATLRAFDQGRHPVAVAAAEEGFGVVDQLSMVNVALQAQTLASHPLVRARHRAGSLEVIGLFYDIGTAAALRVTPVSVDRLVEVAE